MKNTLEIYTPELLVSDGRLLIASTNASGATAGHPFKEDFSKNILSNKEETVKKENRLMSVMELPVNNFLKTLKEIEAEFYFVFNSIRTAITEIPDTLDTFGRLMKKTENTLPLTSISMEIPEYLEENY